MRITTINAEVCGQSMKVSKTTEEEKNKESKQFICGSPVGNTRHKQFNILSKNVNVQSFHHISDLISFSLRLCKRTLNLVSNSNMVSILDTSQKIFFFEKKNVLKVLSFFFHGYIDYIKVRSSI